MQWHKNQPQRDANLIEKYVNWMQRVVKSPQQDAKQEEKWCPQRDTKWLQEAKQSWKETTKEMQNDQQKKNWQWHKTNTKSSCVWNLFIRRTEGLFHMFVPEGCCLTICPRWRHDHSTLLVVLSALEDLKHVNMLPCSRLKLHMTESEASARQRRYRRIVEVLVKPSGPLLSSWPLHSSHISHRSRLPGRPRGFTHRQTDSTSCAQSCWGTASWQRCMWGLFSLGNVSC